jgi:hypothetical protein
MFRSDGTCSRVRIMRHLVIAVLALGAAVFGLPEPAATAEKAGFLAGTEDIPLMPGLANDLKTLVVFDKPQGRIVEVEAKGKVTRAGVEKFYATTLPELGWAADGPRSWAREGEGLRYEFKGSDGNLRVGFSLSPR